MTIRNLAGMVGIALLLAAPASAQTATPATGGFDSLSPGNQKIAEALFSAQRTTGTTRTALTRDQIAGLKSTEGWGRVFKQMRAGGLIQARNLGQVVSHRNHLLHAATTNATGRSASTGTRSASRSTGMTRTAMAHRWHASGGHAMRFASARGHGSARFTGGRSFASGPRAVGGGFGPSGTGGFGHAAMGGGGGGHGGGHGR